MLYYIFFSPHLTNASALPCETRKLHLFTYMLRAAAPTNTQNSQIINWLQLNHDRTYAPVRT